MRSILFPITALMLGVASLLLGTGLLNSLIALRGGLEGFSDQLLGLMGSSYFVGFFAGTWITPYLIRRMGHIRAFAFFCATITACVLLHLLYVHAEIWIVLRFLTGVSIVGFYAVIESWLGGSAPPERRGFIFAVYMIVNLVALGCAQLFLRWNSPGVFNLFAVSAIFAVLAILPVTATRLQPPAIVEVARMSLRRLWLSAPVAAMGAVSSGLAMGSFWTLSAAYLNRLGLGNAEIGTFLSLTILAGALFQWPIGWLSDRFDRRLTLAWVGGLACITACLLALAPSLKLPLLMMGPIFGLFLLAVYPIVVAHLVDHLHRDEILAGNTALLMLHGIAAALGPSLAGWAMTDFGPNAFPAFLAVALLPMTVLAALQYRRSMDVIVEEPAHFKPMVRTSPAVLELMAEAEPAQMQDTPIPRADSPSTEEEIADARENAQTTEGAPSSSSEETDAERSNRETGNDAPGATARPS